MKIAVCSDELYPVNDFVIKELERLGHEIMVFGAPKTRKNEPWAKVTQEAALAVSQGLCEEGIFFCWTGTGASIIANKINNIRAALCTDAQTAAGARIWNGANVLVLSNRLLTIDLAKEILVAWFNTSFNQHSMDAIDTINKVELLPGATLV